RRGPRVSGQRLVDLHLPRADPDALHHLGRLDRRLAARRAGPDAEEQAVARRTKDQGRRTSGATGHVLGPWSFVLGPAPRSASITPGGGAAATSENVIEASPPLPSR